MFIGGRFELKSSDGGELSVVNPFNEEEICKVPCGTKDDVKKAVGCAKFALDGWSKLGGVKRGEYLVAIAKEIAEQKAELSELETKDCGKPYPESEWDLDDCSACFEYYAGLAKNLEENMQNKPVDVGDSDYECTIRYEPAGVAGCIIPFNYPLLMAIWKVAPALAAGCTVVLKPSELTPLTAIELGKICQKVNLPEGVLNIVLGDGKTGQAIVEHPDVDCVAFTGSVATGIKISQAAAPLVKKVGAELGGKSAAIVFPDADLNKAAEWVCFGCWWTNGQICSATSRLLVDESIADEFIEKLKIIGQGIQMGDPMAEGGTCRLGPLVSAKQQEKVLNFVQQGVAQGGKLILGTGKKPTEKGYFVEPTLIKVENESKNICWEEEIFGPVLTVKTFKSEQEAINMANHSKYGLAGAVFTKDKEKANRVANALQVGIVWKNASQPCFPQLPWGGRKLSGFGRDLGEFGLEKFLEPKQIVNYVSDAKLDWYDTSKL